MSIEVSYMENDTVVVVHVQKLHTVKDFIDTINNDLIPHARKFEASTLVHFIADWREVDWSFPDLVAYLSSTAERRKNNPPPTNGRYYYIGAKAWINAWRTYMLKNFGIETGSFQSLEDALLYIRNTYKASLE
jgi:hypothetical protein